MAKWPKIENFIAGVTHNLQVDALNNARHYVMSDSQRLNDIAETYGDEGAKTWIGSQLIHPLGLSNANDAETDRLMNELTTILLERFRYERYKVFIHFCAKVRAREYKVAYGCVKLDAILESANDYLKNLSKLKEKIGSEMQQTAVKEYNNWKYITYRGLFWARRDSVMELWERNGAQGLRLAALNEDDAYYASVRTLMGIGALIPNPTMSEWAYDNEKFNAHVERLRLTEDCYRPTRKEEDYHL